MQNSQSTVKIIIIALAVVFFLLFSWFAVSSITAEREVRTSIDDYEAAAYGEDPATTTARRTTTTAAEPETTETTPAA